MQNFNITGDGNVIGTGNRVITRINNALTNDPDRKAAAEALALLRAEIESLDIADKYKRRSERAIEDVEDELVESDPEPEPVQSALQRVNESMMEAGETYDAAAGWVQRLTNAVHAISRLIPEAEMWFPS